MENNSFLFSLVFIYLISLQHITYANYNQIEILDDFRLSARQYTELLKTIITESEISQDSGDVNGTFFIKSLNNETFDVLFLENITQMICYQKVILSMNYSGYCDFPMLLNQTNYTLDLVNNKINKWVSNSSLIIIDNTPFPINGANGIADILIASSYLISIAPSNTYHNWTEILAITMGISLFIVFILIIFLYFKTKRIKNQNLHERLVADNQNFKIKGKDVKASRKERINYDERDIDLRREKSNSIVISKSILAEMKNEKRFLEFN